MSAQRVTLPWSVLHRPDIISAGLYPVSGKNSGHVSRSEETIALHHHAYEGAFHIGQHRYELRSGDLTLTPAGVDSLHDLPGEGTHLCIRFRHIDTAGCEETHLLRLPLHLRLGGGSEPIRQRILWITDLYRRADHADPRKRALALAAASAGLQEIILTLALLEPEEELADLSSVKVLTAVQTFVDLVDTRLKDPLSVPELSEEVRLSQNYLARAFRHRYGMTMPHFILVRRIELACHLLITTRASVTQIAAEAGLPDVQHFNKQFRKITGLSPSAYREANGSKQTSKLLN